MTTTTQLDARRTGPRRHEVLGRAGRLAQELHEYASPQSADEGRNGSARHQGS